MSDLIPTWKVVEDEIPPIGKHFRHYAKWHSWDCHNLTKHAVFGPIFRNRHGDQEIDAFEAFTKLFHQGLLDYPPCDPQKILDEKRAKL